MKRRRSKKKFASFIVTLVIILNTLFTCAVLYTFLKVGNEPSVLIGSWFAFTTGELWMLSNIKNNKTKLLQQGITEETINQDDQNNV